MNGRAGSRTIAQELRRLTLITALPFVALIGLLAYFGYQGARGSAEGFVRRQAARVSIDVEKFLTKTEHGLRLIAARPDVRRMDPSHCDSGLADLIATNPEYANVNVIDRAGWVICGAKAPPGGPHTLRVSDREWFQAVMAGKPFAAGMPRMDPILNRWVSTAAVPITGPDGTVAGAVSVAVDLATWDPHGNQRVLPEGTVLGVIDGAGTILTRFPEADKWIGRNNRDAEITATMLRLKDGVFDAQGVLGFERIWSVTPVLGTNWLAFAGVTTADALRPSLQNTAYAVALAAVALAVAVWLALMASRRLALPIAGIARAARTRAAGSDDLVPVAGPKEVEEVAQELNRMIDALQRAAAEVRTLSRAVAQSPASIVITDPKGNIEYVNPRFEQITGYTRAEAIGANPRILKSGMTPAETYARLWKAISEGGEWHGELCNRRKNGELFWEFAAISGLKNEDGQVGHYVAVKEDITERKRTEDALLRAHEMLRQLTIQLNSRHEAESAILSRELHDEFGQMLTSLKMDLSWIATRLGEDNVELKRKISSSLALVDTSVQSVRSIAARLRPRILDELGLLPAIEWLVEDFRERSGINAAVVSNARAHALKPVQATAVFRITQEALSNIVRHADAKRVDVSLSVQDEWLTLEIRDNGKGMREDAQTSYESIGLLGMRERALAAGGELGLEAVHGRGTVVTLRLPLAKEME